MTTTRTRTRTKTTPPVEETIVEQDASAETLRGHIERCTQAINGLNLRISDLQEQIDALTTTEENIAQEQETRTSHIHSLQEEIGRIGLELEDLTFDTTIKGDAATAGSVQRRVDLQSTVKGTLQTAQKEHNTLLRDETERLSQLAEDKKLLLKQCDELETQRNTFATKQAAISDDLGHAIYREGSEHLAELARSRRGASLDAKHFEEEEGRARQALKLSLQPWYGLRQKAVREFDLDQKAPDGLTHIVLSVIDLLNVLESDGRDVPMLLDGNKPAVQQLSPLDANVLRSLIGLDSMKGLDRATWFRQRREQLQSLLIAHNAARW